MDAENTSSEAGHNLTLEPAHFKESKLLLGAEIAMLALWTLLVTRPYLNLDPALIPQGREYLSAIQTHDLWRRAVECGVCALWNGAERGGAPAFADIHSSMLHPLVIVTTLVWGVINGSKLALVGAFFIAGFAQWWLAHALRLNPLARLWSASMAVVAGNLAGRMELGAFGVVLSTASCALVLPALVVLNQTGTRRAAVLLGLVSALALLAGQGYMQIGLLFVSPVALLLLPGKRKQRMRVLRRYALAGIVALLLAAPFLVPYVHFLPEFYKEIDPEFRSAQPLPFIPLNLVINDYGFFNSEVLDKLPYPHLYVNYVGWIPVLLAVWGCFGHMRETRWRVVRFSIAFSFFAFWVASAEPLRWFATIAPSAWIFDWITGIRHPSQMAGLAIPAILTLSALGLDHLLNMPWMQIHFVPFPRAKRVPFDMALLVVIPLTIALASAQQFGSQWIDTWRMESNVQHLLEALQTPDLQWVNPPFGEHFYIEPAVALGLKMHFGIRTWNWRDRELPAPVLEANRAGPPPEMTEKTVVDGIPIYAAPPGREYAAVTHADGTRTICVAHGIGGDIDIECDLPQSGILRVIENSWDGWAAQANGQALTLMPGQWLSVDLPAGKQAIQFRYRPWDVPLGVLLFALGAVLAARLFFATESATTIGRQ